MPVCSAPTSLTPFFKRLVYGRNHSDLQLAVQDIERSAQGATNVLAVVALPLDFLTQVLEPARSLSLNLGILVSGR